MTRSVLNHLGELRVLCGKSLVHITKTPNWRGAATTQQPLSLSPKDGFDWFWPSFLSAFSAEISSRICFWFRAGYALKGSEIANKDAGCYAVTHSRKDPKKDGYSQHFEPSSVILISVISVHQR